MSIQALNPLMTVQDVAEALGVSVPTVRRWIRDGELDAVRLGSRGRASVRVAPGAVLRFIETRPSEGAAP